MGAELQGRRRKENYAEYVKATLPSAGRAATVYRQIYCIISAVSKGP